MPTSIPASVEAPPLTFEDAERRSPFGLLIELYEQATRCDASLSADDHLAELALSAAVVSWWSRWQPITIHRALRAGASLAGVAGALGVEPAEAYTRWDRWALVQSTLVIAGRPAVDPDEFAAIRKRVRAEVRP